MSTTTVEIGDVRTCVAQGYVCAKCDGAIPVGATFAWFPERRERVCGECGNKTPGQGGNLAGQKREGTQ